MTLTFAKIRRNVKSGRTTFVVFRSSVSDLPLRTGRPLDVQGEGSDLEGKLKTQGNHRVVKMLKICILLSDAPKTLRIHSKEVF